MRRWLACFVVVVHAWSGPDPLGIDEDENAIARVVRMFPKKPGEPELPPRQEYEASMPMRDKTGGTWLCRFPVRRPPPPEDRSVPPPESVEAYVRWRNDTWAERCAEAPDDGGYWKYELCLGKMARQFQRQQAPKRQTQRDDDVEQQQQQPNGVHLLGLFDAQQQGEPPRFASAEELQRLFGGGAEEEDSRFVASWPPHVRSAIVETYGKGSDGRSATAYVACLLAESEIKPAKLTEKARQVMRSDNAKMYDADEKYVRLAAVVEQPEKHYHLLVAAPTLVCATEDLVGAAIAREVKALDGACLRRKRAGEWWTYEVCVGKAVRQFHARSDDGKVDERDRADGFLIGSFASSETLEWEPNLVDLGLPVWRRGFPYTRVHSYDNGDACDLTGTPRSATVRFRCEPESKAVAKATKPPFIASVVETLSCEYDIVVSLPAACLVGENDLMTPQAAAKRRLIDCDQVSQETFDHYNDGFDKQYRGPTPPMFVWDDPNDFGDDDDLLRRHHHRRVQEEDVPPLSSSGAPFFRGGGPPVDDDDDVLDVRDDEL
mmetsp:Transcript_16681/g.50547  ORF Transcript_16681/g.50547 Transcript_16681/m.50547 type:complete len:547 (-) Transcript_16681:574-2214(-)